MAVTSPILISKIFGIKVNKSPYGPRGPIAGTTVASADLSEAALVDAFHSPLFQLSSDSGPSKHALLIPVYDTPRGQPKDINGLTVLPAIDGEKILQTVSFTAEGGAISQGIRDTTIALGSGVSMTYGYADKAVRLERHSFWGASVKVSVPANNDDPVDAIRTNSISHGLEVCLLGRKNVGITGYAVRFYYDRLIVGEPGNAAIAAVAEKLDAGDSVNKVHRLGEALYVNLAAARSGQFSGLNLGKGPKKSKPTENSVSLRSTLRVGTETPAEYGHDDQVAALEVISTDARHWDKSGASEPSEVHTLRAILRGPWMTHEPGKELTGPFFPMAKGVRDVFALG